MKIMNVINENVIIIYKQIFKYFLSYLKHVSGLKNKTDRNKLKTTNRNK
jgi:hypothetical protein